MQNKKSILLLPLILALPFYGGPGCSIPKNDGGVYKTTDRGANWKQIITIEDSKDALVKADTEQIVVDPNNPEVVFLVTSSNGLYVSNRFGESWKKILPEAGAVYSIEADSKKSGVFYASILLNNRAKIVKTEDGGQNWSEVYTEAGKGDYVTKIKVNPFLENSLIAVNSKGLVVRSSDSGNTWQAAFPFKEPVIDISFDLERENLVWVLTQKGIWYSQDNGSDFKLLALDANGEMGNKFYLLRKEPAGLFLASDKGFFQSRDNGRIWKKIITLNNPTDFPVREFAVFPVSNEPSTAEAPVDKWAVAAGMTVYLTDNGGENWKPIQFEIDRMVNAIAIKKDDPNQILVGVKTVRNNALIGF